MCNLSFDSFPKDNGRRSKWVVAMRHADGKGQPWHTATHAVLCCRHFKADMFDRTGQIVRLRSDAVPTLFDFTPHLMVLLLITIH